MLFCKILVLNLLLKHSEGTERDFHLELLWSKSFSTLYLTSLVNSKKSIRTKTKYCSVTPNYMSGSLSYINAHLLKEMIVLVVVMRQLKLLRAMMGQPKLLATTSSVIHSGEIN
jgi:hypothetical protein